MYSFLDGIIYGLTIRNKDKIYDDKCSPPVISKVLFRVSQLKKLMNVSDNIWHKCSLYIIHCLLNLSLRCRLTVRPLRYYHLLFAVYVLILMELSLKQ